MVECLDFIGYASNLVNLVIFFFEDFQFSIILMYSQVYHSLHRLHHVLRMAIRSDQYYTPWII